MRIPAKPKKTNRENKCKTWLLATVTVGATVLILCRAPSSDAARVTDDEHDNVNALNTGFEFLPKVSLGNGTWSIADSPWGFHSSTVDANSLTAMLATPPMANGIAKEMIGSSNPTHLAILNLIPESGSSVHATEFGKIRTLELSSMKACLYFRDSQDQTVVYGARFAIPTHDDLWQVNSFIPQNNEAIAEQHLLPLPQESKACCQRFSDAGTLQCEMVQTAFKSNELMDSWRQDGWDMTKVSDANRVDDPKSRGCSVWDCHRSGVHVQARFNSGSDSPTCSLILTTF